MKTAFRFGAALLCFLFVLLCAACAEKTEPLPEAQTVQLPADDYTLTLPIYEIVEEKNPDEDLVYDGFYFDRYDKIIEKKVAGDQVGTWTYEYNEDGLLQFETFNSDEGYETTEYEYDENGRISKVWIRSDYSDRDWYRYSYEYEVDDLDRPVTLTIRNTRGDYSAQVFTYEYDENSNPVHETLTEYGNGIYRSPTAVYKKENTFNFFGDLVRTVTTADDAPDAAVTVYKYGCVEKKTLASKADDNLVSASEWKRFDEAPDLVQPDCCDKLITQQEKTERSGAAVYTYQLPQDDDEATKRLQIYQAILRDCCALRFREDKNGAMQILKQDETVVALLETGRDASNNKIFRLIMQNNG